MRSCMRAHCSGNGSGVSATRGSAKPNAVFIAGRGWTRGGTSYGAGLRLRRGIGRLLDGLERVQGMVHVCVLMDEAELKGASCYRYRRLGSAVEASPSGQAPISLATQAAHSKLPATRNRSVLEVSIKTPDGSLSSHLSMIQSALGPHCDTTNSLLT